MEKESKLTELQVDIQAIGFSGNGLSGNGLSGNGLSGNGANDCDCQLNFEKEINQLKLKTQQV